MTGLDARATTTIAPPLRARVLMEWWFFFLKQRDDPEYKRDSNRERERERERDRREKKEKQTHITHSGVHHRRHRLFFSSSSPSSVIANGHKAHTLAGRRAGTSYKTLEGKGKVGDGYSTHARAHTHTPLAKGGLHCGKVLLHCRVWDGMGWDGWDGWDGMVSHLGMDGWMAWSSTTPTSLSFFFAPFPWQQLPQGGGVSSVVFFWFLMIPHECGFCCCGCFSASSSEASMGQGRSLGPGNKRKLRPSLGFACPCLPTYLPP